MNIEYFNRITAVYGLGVDEFLSLFEAQGHKCASCYRGLVLFSEEPGERPVVDHDHSSGKVRGILCSTCNVCIGWIEKDRQRTAGCVAYLERELPKIARNTAPPQSAGWNAAQWRHWRMKSHRERKSHIESVRRILSDSGKS